MNASTRPLVAFVSDAEEFAGAEQYIVVIIEALREQYDFVVVHGTGAPAETREKAAGVGARTIAVRGLRRRPSPAAPPRLVKTLRSLRPSLVHINASDQGDGIGVFPLTRLVRAPVIATLHNVIPKRARWRDAIGLAMLRRPERIIAVSDRLGRYLSAHNIRNVVVKNAMSPPQLNPNARSLLGLGDDEFVVGGIGRLHAQKGWDVLCDAAALVHEQRSDIRFVVIGDGPERERLAHHPCADHVTFTGYIADAATLLGAFDVLVIPSRYEGLGLVAIDGMFAGVPIIASGIEGLVEVVGDCGRIVPPDRADFLAAAVLWMASDPTERADLATRARRRAERLFRLERMAEETAAVYEGAIGGPLSAGSRYSGTY